MHNIALADIWRRRASQPVSHIYTERERAILSFADLRWNVRNARWCSEQEVSPNITLAAVHYLLWNTNRTKVALCSCWIYLVKNEKKCHGTLFYFLFFCFEHVVKCAFWEKIIKFAPNSQLDRAYASRAAFLSRCSMPQSCTQWVGARRESAPKFSCRKPH